MARGLGQLATCVLAQQNKIRAMEERMNAMWEMILGLEHTAANPIVVDKEETVVEAGSSSHWGQRGCYPGGKLGVY